MQSYNKEKNICPCENLQTQASINVGILLVFVINIFSVLARRKQYEAVHSTFCIFM